MFKIDRRGRGPKNRSLGQTLIFCITIFILEIFAFHVSFLHDLCAKLRVPKYYSI